MTAGVWKSGHQTTIAELFRRRLETDPDSEYLDVNGVRLTAGELMTRADRVGAALASLGTVQHDRVATLIESSADAVTAWTGTVTNGRVSVPINTAYKGDYLRHQLADSGAKVVFVTSSLYSRVAAVADQVPDLAHIVIIADDPEADGTGGAGGTDGTGRAAGSGRAGEEPRARTHSFEEILAGGDDAPTVDIRPSDLGTFIYTGGTTGLSKGCMLTHNYHEALARQIGVCWERTAEDVAWTPLPLFHFNALATVICGTLVYGGRGAIYRKFSVSNFWPEMNRVGATITSTLGTMAYLLAHDVDRPEMPRSGAPEANTTLRTIAAVPLPTEVDTIIRDRFGVETFSGAYGVTEASLISWQPPDVSNKPGAAGVVNDEYFDVRIFDDDDNELPASADGEIVIRPKRPHVMFEGYWGRPEVTVETSRNWWYHTGDIGKIDEDRYLYFVDRKADYLRRRGENIASYEVESILMGHGQLADVAVHAVPSQLTEDDLKITATLVDGSKLTEEELFRWCIDKLPYFVLPRYIEFRAQLPRSPVGRVLKRELRAEGPTATTWDAETSGITYDKR